MSSTALKTLILSTLFASTALGSGFVSSAKELGVQSFKLQLGTKFKNLEGLDQLSKLSSSLKLETKVSLVDDLVFNFKGGLVYETGSAKSAFNERRYTPKSRASYEHAYIAYTPFSFIELQAGSINNSDERFVSDFVNSHTTALGLREILSYESENFELSASATQVIPSNDELSNRIGSIDEKRARFYQEMVYTKIRTTNIDVQAQVGHFAYEQLSSDVANADRYFGNTVSGENEFAAYTYSFKGWVYGLELELKLNDSLSVSPYYSAIKNDEINSSDKNTGSVQGVKFKTDINSNEVELKLANFENQSDTAPAYYNGSFLKNDFKGQLIELKISNPNNLETTFNFINRTPVLNQQDVLGGEKVISIGLRKTYDIF